MATTVVLTVLNRKNYDNWSSRVKTYLLAEDLWNVIDQGTDAKNVGNIIDPVPGTIDHWNLKNEGSAVLPKIEGEEKAHSKDWKKKNAKALYAIQNSCGDDTYELIKDKTTAKEAWDTLLQKFRPHDSSDETSSYESANLSDLEQFPKPPQTTEEAEYVGHDWIFDDIHGTFVKFMRSNDWDNAIKFLRQNPPAGKTIFVYGNDPGFCLNGTALHYAIRQNVNLRIIQQLVELMETTDLERQSDMERKTALYVLIEDGTERVEVAKCMLAKSPNLLTILPGDLKDPLVVVAQATGKGERMARYLYSITPHEALEQSDAAHLIFLGFYLNKFDIAWDLIQRYPQLGTVKNYFGDFPLMTLANNRFAFLSESRLNLWEKLIYSGINIKPLPLINKDIEKPEGEQSDQGHISDKKENQRHLISSDLTCDAGMGLFQRLVLKLQTLIGINRIYEMKLMHERVKQFLPLMCEARYLHAHDEISEKQNLCVAAEQGHVEYIIHFLKNSSYDILQVMNEKDQNIFQIAAECRHRKVYNLIYVLEQFPKRINVPFRYQTEKQFIAGDTDKFGNNLLHTVASITPLSQIDHIQGAALQMQRELQWFKEVESIADPRDFESVNNDGKTPREVFTENHKDLRKEAEKSMKETSTSCTVVGALIVTIMFAAAFTVPGGNNEKTSLPTFLTKKVFTTFIVSDAISLFSSTTSVIMFLGILTSRYSKDDFYKSLPTKMIIGLFTLFVSIASMMIVFSCALYIMLDGKPSIVIPSIMLTSVPVTSFIWMQFPLLVEALISTYGPRMFGENKSTWFRFLCDH